MIRAIVGKLDIPASALIQPYELATTVKLQRATNTSESGNK